MSLRQLATDYVGKFVYDNIDTLDAIGKNLMESINANSQQPVPPTILMNSYEMNQTYYYELEIPGVGKENIKIQQKEGYIRVSGERKKLEVSYQQCESTFGKFERKFRLPEDADPKTILANFQNGMLILLVNKFIENSSDYATTIQIS